MLSLNAVECIVIWREQMLFAYNQSTPNNRGPSPAIPFLWGDINYLAKMKTDTDFLKDHALSKWFNFSEKNDPFLVIPSCAHSGVGLKGLKKGRSKKQSKSKLLQNDNKYEVPLDNSLMQRIKASEVVLEKESGDTPSDASMSPNTNKDKPSPMKNSTIGDENMDPNQSQEDDGPKRESLFDLRKKKNNDSKKSLESTTPKQASSKQTPAIIAKTEPTPIKEEAEVEEEETFEYTLKPLGLSESDAVSYLESYLPKLDENLQKSFAPPEELFQKSMKDNNPQWYGLHNKGSKEKVDGVFIYTFDFNFDRVNILHLSTVNKKGMETAISTVLAHIWAKECCHDIRIGLYHFEVDKDGKSTKAVDPELKDALKKNKMRWKNILNEDNNRILMMGANRAKGEEVQNELNSMLAVKSALLFSTSSDVVRPQSATVYGSMFFQPTLYLSSLMGSVKYDEEADYPIHHTILYQITDKIKEDSIEALPLTATTKTEDPSTA